MRRPLDRRRRPRLETLEARALLAVAGAIDPSFGDRGVVTLPLSGSGLSGTGITDLGAVQAADGKILLGGSYGDDFTVERLDADGTPDPTFGQGGRATIQVAATTSEAGVPPLAEALLVQGDGSILMVGSFDSATVGFGVLKLTPAGALDTSYGTGGFAILPATLPQGLTLAGLQAATLTSTGQLVLAGSASTSAAGSSEIFATRLDADGSVDTSFGTSGFATSAIDIDGHMDAVPTAVAIQPGGRIIVIGNALRSITTDAAMVPQTDAVVIGLTAGGIGDDSFGNSAGGVVDLTPDLAQIGQPGDRAVDALAIQPDGAIVLGGGSYLGSTYQAPTGSLIRLTAAGALDASFGTGGSVVVPRQTIRGVTVDDDGRILAAGGTVAATPQFALGRFDADGSPDTSFGQPATPGLAVYPTTLAGINSGGTYQGSLSRALIARMATSS